MGIYHTFDCECDDRLLELSTPMSDMKCRTAVLPATGFSSQLPKYIIFRTVACVQQYVVAKGSSELARTIFVTRMQ